MENYWLIVCIVGELVLGCCLSAARLFNSEIITASLKYLYRSDGAAWRQELCADALLFVRVCTVELQRSKMKSLLKAGGFCCWRLSAVVFQKPLLWLIALVCFPYCKYQVDSDGKEHLEEELCMGATFMCNQLKCLIAAFNLFLKKEKKMNLTSDLIHMNPTKKSMMVKMICHVLCSLCGRLSGLVRADYPEPNHQVITVLCGPRRQQIRLRGSMICSWKSTPLKLKSILSERLPKDKVPCVIKRERTKCLSLCLCVDWPALCVCVCFTCAFGCVCSRY